MTEDGACKDENRYALLDCLFAAIVGSYLHSQAVAKGLHRRNIPELGSAHC